MEIQLNHREPRDETRQIAYVTISGFNDHTYRFQVGDVPADLATNEDVLEHLNSRSDELHLFCLKKTYPGYNLSEFRTEENTELEAFLEWIEAGAENPDGIVIENHIFAGTHPLRYPPSLNDLNEALTLINDFADTNYQDLSDRIEDDLTSIPKVREYLVELSKAFLALVRLVDSK